MTISTEIRQVVWDMKQADSRTWPPCYASTSCTEFKELTSGTPYVWYSVEWVWKLQV